MGDYIGAVPPQVPVFQGLEQSSNGLTALAARFSAGHTNPMHNFAVGFSSFARMYSRPAFLIQWHDLYRLFDVCIISPLYGTINCNTIALKH